MTLPTFTSEATKNDITLGLASDPDLLQEFQNFCKNNLGFLYGQLKSPEVRQQWDLFLALKEVKTEKIEAPALIEVDDEIGVELHNIIFNGVSVRDQQVRRSDGIHKDGYLNWLEQQKENIENWLQSIRDEPTFQDTAYLKQEIPKNEPLYIRVDWLPKVEYVATDRPTLNSKNELRVSKKQTLVIRGKSAQNSNSRKSSSPLDFNATEQISVFNQDFFYLPYEPQYTPEFDYQDKEGNSIKVTKIEMVLGKKEVPNHLWSSCLIQSADRKTTYFSFQTLKKQSDEKSKKEKHFISRDGFQGFQAQMHSGGYSDKFTTYLNKMRPDGTPLTQNGAVVIRKCDVRFRIASVKLNCDSIEVTERGLSHAGTGSQYNQSVDKTNNVWLDVRDKEGVWGAESYLIGRAHFSSMAPTHMVEECSTIVDNYKIVVKTKAKHILSLMADSSDRTPEIQKECRKFKPCTLIYQNGVLYTSRNSGKNAYGHEELKPLYKRTVRNYTPVVFLQRNPDSVKILHQYQDVFKHCDKWLYKNHEQWLDIKDISARKSKKKSATDKYVIDNHLQWMAKQVCRWGYPVFTDTEIQQRVTEDVVYTILGSATVGVLDITGHNWSKCRYDLLKLFAKLYLGESYWESLTDKQKVADINKLKLQFKVDNPNDLFSPSKMGLAGDKFTNSPPHPTWFRLIEFFFKAVGVGISYTHYSK